MRVIRHLCCQCGMEECGAYREYCDECQILPPIGVMEPADVYEPVNPSYAEQTKGHRKETVRKHLEREEIKLHYQRVIDQIWVDAVKSMGT